MGVEVQVTERSRKDRYLRERRALQVCVAVGGIVPVVGGGTGIVLGPEFMQAINDSFGDSHFRYLSGLLLGIGLGFWSTIPRIEANEARFKTLTLIVFAGGSARLVSLFAIGPTSLGTWAALLIELGLTPLLYWWQRRLSRQACVDSLDEGVPFELTEFRKG